MSRIDRFLNKQEALGVVGLGYVGLPLAVAFSEHMRVVGFDADDEKAACLNRGKDPTGEVGDAAVAVCGATFSADPSVLRDARFIIVAVPTPVHADHSPDLSLLEAACRTVGQQLQHDAIVVFESTVYPGVTEEICVPLLESASGMVCGVDFTVGYSPERINPGDPMHRLDTVIKVVAGMNDAATDMIAAVYATVAKAGVYRAPSIRVAEAAKVIENCQRDINIAFVNELSQIFHLMDIDTKAVLEAAGTKWNFLPFTPGLVGGHCIGVDPYYLTYKADSLGYHSQIIAAGRRINDAMGKYVAEHTIKQLLAAGVPVKGARIAILGLTFKENCPDTRNTRVIDIVNELREYGVEPLVVDPVADAVQAQQLYGITLIPLERVDACDAVIVAVAHDAFRALSAETIEHLYKAVGNEKKLLVDVKGIFDRVVIEARGLRYWRL